MVAANTAFDNRYVDRSVDSGLASTSEDKVYNKRPEINAAYYERVHNKMLLTLNWLLCRKPKENPVGTAGQTAV